MSLNNLDMSLFISDNSTQINNAISYLPTSWYSNITNPSFLFNDGTSGIYNPSANNIQFFTNNTDALIIDSNQN